MKLGQENPIHGLLNLIICGGLCVVAAHAQTNRPPAFASVSVAEAPTKALQVVGSNLFVAAWGRGVQVLDISDPAHPRWKGGWNPRQCPVGIHVVGDYAFVANRTSGLSVLDVRNPANPVLVGSVRYSGDAMAINVAGRYAYVADYPKGFRIIDVQNPAQPVVLGGGSLPQGANSVHVVGDYACFTEPMGLHIFDVRDPLDPKPVGSPKIMGQYSRVQIVGQHAFVAAGQGGLLILDLTDPASPQPVDRLMPEANSLPIIAHNSNGFSHSGYIWMLTNAAMRAQMERRLGTNLPDMKGLVENVRRSPLYNDARIRTTGMSRYLHGLHVTDRFTLALGAGLEVIDISDVTRPVPLARYELNGLAGKMSSLWDVRGAGRYAYVMDNGANILVVDLGNPTRPVEVSNFSSRRFVSPVLAVDEIGKPPIPPSIYPGVPPVTEQPELSSPHRLADGTFAFTLSGIARATYVIHATTDLISWVAISTNTLPADGRARITDGNAVTHAHRFYRAVMQ